MMKTFRCTWPTYLVALLLAAVGAARADDLKVVAPNAVKDSVLSVTARFEKDTGHRVSLSWGGSEAIARRVAEGEVFDVVVNTAPALDRMLAEGRLAAGSRIDFGRTAVAVAVRAGLPRPDVSSAGALKAALAGAQTVAISSGASGRYLEQLFQRLGVAEQVRPKLRQPPSGTPIGEMLVRGEADLGFQQVPEMMHVQGIQYLGPLPDELQGYTVWSSAVHTAAPKPEAARAFSRALAAPPSASALREAGVDPL